MTMKGTKAREDAIERLWTFDPYVKNAASESEVKLLSSLSLIPPRNICTQVYNRNDD